MPCLNNVKGWLGADVGILNHALGEGMSSIIEVAGVKEDDNNEVCREDRKIEDELIKQNEM